LTFFTVSEEERERMGIEDEEGWKEAVSPIHIFIGFHPSTWQEGDVYKRH
jgi:hypothetical protein